MNKYAGKYASKKSMRQSLRALAAAVPLFLILATLIVVPPVAIAQEAPSTGATGATGASGATGPVDPAGKPTIASDKADYMPGEQVTLTGTNWADGEIVHIVVNDTLGQSWKHTVDVVADSEGNLTDVFNLPGYFVSNYDVTATGPISGVATTTFTDLSIGTYDQCANDDGDGYTTGDQGCRWIFGNLQKENSTYFEGDATPQRLWLTDLVPNSPHNLVLQYGTTKGGKHAYDFLTTWDWSEDWIVTADRCQDITGCATAPETYTDIPQDPNVPDSFEPSAPGDRQFTMRGGTLTSATTPAVFSGDYTGDSETRITVSFTVSDSGSMCHTKQGVTTCDVALWFGAHVASQVNWGAGTGAGNISGSPYHVALKELDSASIGSRDNQMQAGAVVPNGTIIIVKNAIPDDPQDFHFNLTNGGSINIPFDLDDDGTLQNPSALPNTTAPQYSVPPGTYTAVETAPLPPWSFTSLVCVDPTTNTTTNGATATINLASGETVTCTYTNSATTAPTVVTDIHNGDDHTTSVTSVPLGSTVHDKATVSGGFGTPTGTVTFSFFNTIGCTGTAIGAGTVALDANGVAHPSTAQGPLAAGSYSFKAHYNGGGPYTAADSACEPLTVTQAQLTVNTQVHDAAHANKTNGSVPLGSVVHDTATTTGGVSGFPVPATTFTFYANGTCDGPGTSVANTGADEVVATAVRSAASAVLGAGSYSYKGAVAGNTNYLGDDSDCEPFTVGKNDVDVTTLIHDADHEVITSAPLGSIVHDSVNVADADASGLIPTGGVRFKFFTTIDCTGDFVPAGGGVLDEDGNFHPSNPQGPLGAGSYSFNASYNGDANFNGGTSLCEPLTIGKNDVDVTTLIHDADHEVITSAPLGSIVHDSVNVADADASGLIPTGGVRFKFFTTIDCTGDFVPAGGGVLDEDGNFHPSNPQGPLGAGSYSFNASYNGDANFNGGTSLCEPLTIGKNDVDVTTLIHDADHEVITSAPLGSIVHDSVNVADADASGLIPTGGVRFKFFTTIDCTGDFVPAGGGVLDEDGNFHPSNPQGPLGAGSYSFNASYNGDANFNGGTSLCEPLTIGKNDVDVTTLIHDADHEVITSAPLGSIVHDSVNVADADASGLIPTGGVRFKFFTTIDCTGDFVPAGGGVLDEDGNFHPSNPQGPLGAGSYSFNASYNGDANFNGGTSLCEPLTIGKNDVDVTTLIHDADHEVITSAPLGSIVHDSVNVADADASGLIPTGGVRFKFFTTIDCTGDFVPAGGGVLDEDGNFHPSNPQGPLGAGSYSFNASYNGDANFNGGTSLCEPLTIGKNDVDVTTLIHDADHEVITSAPLGSIVHDSVNVADADASGLIPTGGVRFKFFTTIDCTGDFVPAGGGVLDEDGNFHPSNPQGPLGAGSYSFNASYNGDANFNGGTSLCEPLTIGKNDVDVTTLIHDADHEVITSAPLGSIVHDSVNVADADASGLIPTGGVRFKFFTTIDCTGDFVPAGGGVLDEDGNFHPSNPQGPLGAGSYSFNASYNGDANFNGGTSLCEPLTIGKNDVDVTTLIHDADHEVITSAPLGSIVHDSVNVADADASGLIPTGGVRFKFFTTIDCTGDFVPAGGGVLDEDGNFHPSNPQGPLGAGSYSFNASYNGDANFNGGTSLCEPLTIGKNDVDVTTLIHDADHEVITSAPLGSIVHDSVNVADADASGLIPTGGVRFKFFTTIDCTGDFVPAGGGVLDEDGNFHPSNPQGPLGAGSYSFNASYNGDANFNGGTSLCEPLTIGKNDVDVTTLIHDADHEVITSAPLGSIVHDSVNVADADASGLIPTGGVRFKFFTTIDCTGDFVPAGGGVLDEDGNFHPSNPQGPLGAGSYSFNASYNGDANFNGGTSLCEPLTIGKNDVDVTTLIHDADHEVITSAPLGSIVHDSVNVADADASGLIPTGGVRFKFFTTIDCTGDFVPAGGGVLDEDGNFHPSNPQGPLGAGSYSFNASYNGDANFNGGTSLCEPLTIGKNDVDVTTLIHDADHEVITSAPLGSIVHDSVNVADADASGLIPTGGVRFKFFTTIDCTGDFVPAGGGVLDEDGNFHPSNPQGPLGAGSYSFNASYNGDANFNGGTSLCEPLTIGKNDVDVTTLIHDADHEVITSAPLGSIVHDSVNVADADASGLIPTGGVRFKFFTTIDCTGDFVPAGGGVLDEDGNFHPSNPQGPLGAGSYSFNASYNGDANFNGGTSLCEPLTIGKNDVDVTTLIHDADHEVITSAPLGSIVHDSVNVADADASGLIPTGGVRFKFFTTIDCTGDFVPAGGGVLDEDGNFHPSNPQGPLGAGSYSFNASYNGDANFNGGTSLCEPLTIGKNDVDVTTLIHDADHEVITSAPLGSIVHDSVNVADADASGLIPTGGVRFKFFTTIDCTGDFVPAGGGVLDEDGNFHPSNPQGPLGAGSYSFNASYNGDANFNGGTSLCEPLTIGKNDVDVTTLIHDADHNVVTSVTEGSTVHDTVNVADADASGLIPTGGVRFHFFTTIDCTGTSTNAGGGLLDGSGNFDGSTAQGPLTAGNYSFNATYLGDGNFNGGTSACEPLRVTGNSKITPTQTTCQTFSDGTADKLSQVNYSVRNGKISQVDPGVFFYWVKVNATVDANSFLIDQTITTSMVNSYNSLFTKAAGSALFTSACVKVNSATITESNGDVTVSFNAPSAGTYIIGIKYATGAVKNAIAPNPTTVHYTFETKLGVSPFTPIPGTSQGLDLVKKN